MIEYAIQNSDPANLALLALIWWRLDRRLREVRSMVESSQKPQNPQNRS
jgi:hypothetical protein